MRRLKHIFERFCHSKDGQFAVFLGVVAFPTLLATSFMYDYTNSTSQNAKVKAALDSAALAAVTNQNLSQHQRKEYAVEYFWANIPEQRNEVQLEVRDSSDNRVELLARRAYPTTVAASVGIEKIKTNETAVAALTQGDVVCILALDPDGTRAFEVTGGASLTSPTCSVQVNSKDTQASVIDHGGIALSKSFCVSGGAKGSYIPSVNTECRSISDPYANVKPPAPAACIDQEILNALLSQWQAESIGVTLQPGTYCGGLTLDKKVVTFAPGTYIMKDGPLIFNTGTIAKAEDVTFVLYGKDAFLDIDLGSRLHIKAPKLGQLAGLAFMQDTHRVLGKSEGLPSAISTIRSGGNLSIIGTTYLPEQRLEFRGGSLSDSQAPATSFIGYQVSIGDGAKIAVAVDHRSANLPPILPRSDDSARLVR